MRIKLGECYEDIISVPVIEDNKPITRKDAFDYIELYMLTEGGQLQLGELCRRFGVSDEKIRDAGMVWSV